MTQGWAHKDRLRKAAAAERAALGMKAPFAPWVRYGAVTALVLSLFTVSHAVASSAAQVYKVTTAVNFRPYDARLWAAAHAGSRDAAAMIDPSIPDPNAADLLNAASGTALTPLQVKEQAFIGPAANRYVFHGRSATDTSRALQCLTTAIYYEAASESDDGMRGVAQVVLNRVRHPSFPNSVCGVVFQGSERTTGCQFSFACDGAMARRPATAEWLRSRRIAAEALSGRTFPSVGLATHYHTQAIWPYWGKTLVMTNVIGAHIFHRWRGRWGELSAFRQPYAGREPVPGPHRSIADQIAGKETTPMAGVAGGEAVALDPAVAKAIADAKAADLGGRPVVDGSTPHPAPATPARSATTPGFTAAPPVQRDYADPALNTSGEVKEQFKESGSWKTK